MKNLYNLLFFFPLMVISQTTLSAGDVIVTSLIADANDRFEFIPLVDLDAGTEILFTESGWHATNGNWRNNDTTEGVLLYTAPAAVAAGTIISFEEDASDGSIILPTDGSITNSSLGNSWALSVSGDQITIFQGTVTNPSFIFCLTSNSSAWHDATSTTSTAIPTGLQNGNTAVAAGAGEGVGDEFDNVYYDAAAKPLDGKSKSEILALVGNAANWVGSNTEPVDWKITSFTLSSKILETNELNIYPNPVETTLNVSGLNSPVQASVFDMLGKLYIQTEFTNTLDVSALKSGLYMVEIKNEKSSKLFKMIKK